MKYRNKPPSDHIEDACLSLVEVSWNLIGRNDRVVIRYFCVIENSFCRCDPPVLKDLTRVRFKRWINQARQHMTRGPEVIRRQVPRIGSRICDHLVALVELLRDLQCPLCRESKPGVRFPLQGSQIIKQRWRLGCCLCLLGDL